MVSAARLRLCAPLLALALAAPGAAQEPALEGHEHLPEESWGRLPAAAVGKRYHAVGRWESCWGNQVTLFKAAPGFFFADARIQPDLANDLLPGTRTRLVSKKSRVALLGRADRADGRIVLVVEAVRLLDDDVARVQKLAGQAGNDPARLAALAQEARRLAERFDDADLAQLATQLARQELEVRRERLAPDAWEEWLALAAHYHGLGDRTTAIAILSHVETGGPEGASPLRRQAAARLAELAAVRTRAGWVTYERFKADEGFLQRTVDGRARWLTKEQAELEDAMAAERRLRADVVEPRTQPVQHGQNAAAGKLERGQFMQEARLAAGLPVSVLHQRGLDADGPGARQAIWTQWVFADGRRAYFLGYEGKAPVLIAAKAAKDEWPTR
ncbi:MAG: hypothetical protein M9894_03630 [Planctomycetes bacterium]|nr:hypothetical protein [Planctomycetota bacterium]